MAPADDLDDLRPAVTPLDLSTPQRIHVVGLGGAGMRAIARVLVAMGHRVTGSDRADSPHLRRLEQLGVGVHVGHEGANLGDAELLTRSTAVPDANPEVAAALERGVPVLTRADMLSAITRTRAAILVAGTHGKTTTSSMLAVILEEPGLQVATIDGGRGFITGRVDLPRDGELLKE